MSDARERAAQGGPSPRAPRRRPGGLVRRVAAALAKIGALVLAVAILRATLADAYVVPTASMWPMIAPGDRILVAKAAYGLSLPFGRGLLFRADPAAGDVIVFADPRGGGVPFVKRVVALAGQTIAIHAGVVYVDGRAQPQEPLPGGRAIEHLAGADHEAGARDLSSFGPEIVPANSVFVLGDNRGVSLDSRFIGAIPRRLIVGRVLGAVLRGDGSALDPAHLFRAIR